MLPGSSQACPARDGPRCAASSQTPRRSWRDGSIWELAVEADASCSEDDMAPVNGFEFRVDAVDWDAAVTLYDRQHDDKAGQPEIPF